jgi:hypothetical protein
VEEIEMMLRKEFGWNEVVMSERMWRFIGVNTEELLNYGINPHEWIEILRHITIDDAYMLGALHGDLYVRMMSTNWCEIAATTSSTTGVMYFERLMRTIKMPGIDISIRRRRKEGRRRNVIYVKFYILLRRDEWPWHKEDYEIIRSFNTTELLRYVAGLVDTDGSILIVWLPRGHRFEINITSADIEFLEHLRNIIYERLGFVGVLLRDRESGGKLRFEYQEAAQFCEILLPYLSHPMRRLRTKLYQMYYNGELSEEELKHFYTPLEYDNGDDVKRLRAADMLTQAAPQTHTHGEKLKTIKNKTNLPGWPRGLRRSPRD